MDRRAFIGAMGGLVATAALPKVTRADEAKAELKGVTLESLVVAVRVARAVKKLCASVKLDPKDFPLLLHTDEILTDKKPVDIPWESFIFEG